MHEGGDAAKGRLRRVRSSGLRACWSMSASMLSGFMTSVLNCGCRYESRMRLCSSSRTCARRGLGRSSGHPKTPPVRGWRQPRKVLAALALQ